MGAMRANRYAGAAAARASVARAVVLVGTIVALILVAGIVLVVLGANHSNELVKGVHSAAQFLAGPFDGLFKLHGHRLTTAINWGLAAVVWYALAHLISRVLLRR
jgi:hypothetical protein